MNLLTRGFNKVKTIIDLKVIKSPKWFKVQLLALIASIILFGMFMYNLIKGEINGLIFSSVLVGTCLISYIINLNMKKAYNIEYDYYIFIFAWIWIVIIINLGLIGLREGHVEKLKIGAVFSFMFIFLIAVLGENNQQEIINSPDENNISSLNINNREDIMFPFDTFSDREKIILQN